MPWRDSGHFLSITSLAYVCVTCCHMVTILACSEGKICRPDWAKALLDRAQGTAVVQHQYSPYAMESDGSYQRSTCFLCEHCTVSTFILCSWMVFGSEEIRRCPSRHYQRVCGIAHSATSLSTGRKGWRRVNHPNSLYCGTYQVNNGSPQLYQI